MHPLDFSALIVEEKTSSEEEEKLGRNRRLNSACQYLCSSRDFKHTVQSYDMGPTAYFPSIEAVVWIFMAFKIHRPRPDLNPRTLGRVE
jgi:hypothetical protein